MATIAKKAAFVHRRAIVFSVPNRSLVESLLRIRERALDDLVGRPRAALHARFIFLASVK